MKKTLKDWMVRFVCHHARNNMSGNLFALMILPALLIGAIWGYGWPALRHALDFPQVQPVLVAAKLVNLKWLIASAIPAIITYFTLFPICRGVQVLLPDLFEEDVFDDKQT